MMGSIETLKKEKEETIMTKRKAKDSKKENSQSVQSKVWKADVRQSVCVCVA